MKKLLSVLTALAMLLSLGVTVMASGDPSGEASGAPAGTVLTERAEFPGGITLTRDDEFSAPEGSCIVMTVDGVVMSQKAGAYSGKSPQ